MSSDLLTLAERHLPWVVAGGIVALGLLVYGLRDLLGFSGRRVWAMRGVCFDESIRRRVLWITPLAILGVVVVSQLSKSIDEQDAVRQTIKFCLFATGLVVVLTAIILACTSLPKEIDNRVIFTVVTKPTTRLEIVLGKILGFAHVSAVILLIMGVFTYGYLRVQSWVMLRAIGDRIDSGVVEETLQPTLRHYRSEGLLTARTLAGASDLQVLSRVPQPGDDRRFMPGGRGEMLVPFAADRAAFSPPDDPSGGPGATGFIIELRMGYERSRLTRVGDDVPSTSQSEPALPPFVANPDAPAAAAPAGAARVNVAFLDAAMNVVLVGAPVVPEAGATLPDPAGEQPLRITVTPEQAQTLFRDLRTSAFYVQVTGLDSGLEYFAGREPITLLTPTTTRAQAAPVRALSDPRDREGKQVIRPTFRGREGRLGQQVAGAASGEVAAAVYRYRGVPIDAGDAATVPAELRLGVERSDADPSIDIPTAVEITVVDAATGRASESVRIFPESMRTAFFSLPAQAFGDGDFDIVLRCLTDGHYLNVNAGSLQLVTERQSFAFNLFKSLLVLWMLSVLVITISIFCSTFLSWPIAVVLTIVILLGRWGVVQLGDATAPGIGNQVATDLGLRDPAQAKVLSASVERLARMLNLTAAVLPDIGRFAAMEDIERGVSVPGRALSGSLLVLMQFGVPLATCAYVFLRNKEVAP